MIDYEEKYEARQRKASSKYIRTPHRTLMKKEGKLPQDALPGKIIASYGKIYHVSGTETGEASWFSPIECTPAGTMINQNEEGSLAAVGDNVWFVKSDALNDDGIETGSIVMIEERDNRISRQEPGKTNREQIIASNIDNLIILVSAKNPRLNTRQIDRFLVASELAGVIPVIIVNKIDLLNERQYNLIREEMSIYENIHIPVFYTSILNDIIPIGLLYSLLKGHFTLLIGPSGAGKSSLLNYIMKDEVQKVKNISDKTSKGRHTTSFVRMFFLPEDLPADFDLWNDTFADEDYRLHQKEGGAVIDSPGIREFGIWNVEREELALYFHEFAAFDENCRFTPCTHTHEPDCAVKNAVENGEIPIERYASYLNIFETLPERKYE